MEERTPEERKRRKWILGTLLGLALCGCGALGLLFAAPVLFLRSAAKHLEESDRSISLNKLHLRSADPASGKVVLELTHENAAEVEITKVQVGDKEPAEKMPLVVKPQVGHRTMIPLTFKRLKAGDMLTDYHMNVRNRDGSASEVSGGSEGD